MLKCGHRILSDKKNTQLSATMWVKVITFYGLDTTPHYKVAEGSLRNSWNQGKKQRKENKFYIGVISQSPKNTGSKSKLHTQSKKKKKNS